MPYFMVVEVLVGIDLFAEARFSGIHKKCQKSTVTDPFFTALSPAVISHTIGSLRSLR
jgi:hypothetical protein